MKDFKKLLIWQKGMEIAQTSYKMIAPWPGFEKYSLGSQIIRAAISIPSNVAEGNSRNSEKDKRRYLEISLGSSYELETQVLIAKKFDLNEHPDIEGLLNLISEEQKLLIGFMNKLID